MARGRGLPGRQPLASCNPGRLSDGPPCESFEVDPRKIFAAYLEARLADVVRVSKDRGFEVPRQGRDYITVLDPRQGKC